MFQPRVERAVRQIDHETQQQEERGQQEQFALHCDQVAVADVGDQHGAKTRQGEQVFHPITPVIICAKVRPTTDTSCAVARRNATRNTACLRVMPQAMAMSTACDEAISPTAARV